MRAQYNTMPAVNVSKLDQSEMSVFQCPCCWQSTGKNITSHLRHVRLLHADSRSFSLRCNLGCGREKPFNNFLTWRDHVYRIHRNCKPDTASNQSIDPQTSAPTIEPDPDPTQLSQLEDGSIEDDEEPEVLDAVDTSIQNNTASLKRAAATFILKVQEMHRLPQSTMDSIIKEVDSLYQVAILRTCIYHRY